MHDRLFHASVILIYKWRISILCILYDVYNPYLVLLNIDAKVPLSVCYVFTRLNHWTDFDGS